MESSLISTATAIATSPTSRSIIGAGINYFFNKSKLKGRLISVVTPYGKSSLATQFNAEFSASTNMYVFDVEGVAMGGLPEPQRKALQELRERDMIAFNTQFIPICRVVFHDFIDKTFAVHKDMVVIVLLSSRTIKHALELKDAIYIHPVAKWGEDLMMKNPKLKSFFTHCKALIKDSDKSITLVDTWENLYKTFCVNVGAEKSI
jgi:hypothetical protein